MSVRKKIGSKNKLGDPLVRLIERNGRVYRSISLLAHGRLERWKIHPQQALLLRFLQLNGSSSLSDIARDTRTDGASASRSLASLRRARLIDCKADPTDSRRKLFSLTASGKTLMRRLEVSFRTFARDVLAGLSDAERDQWQKLLEKLMDHLGPMLSAADRV